MLNCVVWWIDTIVLEEHAAVIFKVEYCAR